MDKCKTCDIEMKSYSNTLIMIDTLYRVEYVCSDCCSKIDGFDLSKGITSEEVLEKVIEFITYKLMERELLES